MTPDEIKTITKVTSLKDEFVFSKVLQSIATVYCDVHTMMRLERERAELPSWAKVVFDALQDKHSWQFDKDNHSIIRMNLR